MGCLNKNPVSYFDCECGDCSVKTNIRKFKYQDIENKVKWINDSENNRYLHYDLPLELEKTKKWYEKIKDRTDRYDAVIEYNNKPVGVIGLLEIKKGKAEYYVTLGEKNYKGKGIAKSATYLLLNYAFTILKLNTVYLYTETENMGAQKLFEHCGFIKTGFSEKSAVNRGRLVDRYEYQIHASHFFCLSNAEKLVYETPVYRIEDAINQIYIKRDDMLPISFGGNKARKAVNFFNEIDQDGYDCVVTYGSSSSNHCRIISNMAAARNIPCYIVSPLEASNPTYNSRMMEIFGANVTMVPVDEVHDTLENIVLKLKDRGHKPYFIPGGGHGNLGTQAYVDCYEEILKFEKRNHIFFEYIFLASGTGTTQAGLVCGQILHHDQRKIIGISIARKNPRGKQIVLDSIREYLQVKGWKENLSQIEDATHFEDRFTGDGYGKKNKNIQATIQEMMIHHGIPMDSTYTAKAYTGMQNYLYENEVKGKKILFIHTGGTPLFFDDLKMNLP